MKNVFALFVAADLIESISRLPLFLQVILAVIVVGLGFAIVKKFIKLALWLVIIIMAIIAYQAYFR